MFTVVRPMCGDGSGTDEPGTRCRIAHIRAEKVIRDHLLAIADLDARHRTSLPTLIAGDLNAAPDACVRFLTGKQSLAGRSVLYHDAGEIACQRLRATVALRTNDSAQREPVAPLTIAGAGRLAARRGACLTV